MSEIISDPDLVLKTSSCTMFLIFAPTHILVQEPIFSEQTPPQSQLIYSEPSKAAQTILSFDRGPQRNSKWSCIHNNCVFEEKTTFSRAHSHILKQHDTCLSGCLGCLYSSNEAVTFGFRAKTANRTTFEAFQKNIPLMVNWLEKFQFVQVSLGW